MAERRKTVDAAILDALRVHHVAPYQTLHLSLRGPLTDALARLERAGRIERCDGGWRLTAITLTYQRGEQSALLTTRGKDHELTASDCRALAESLQRAARSLALPTSDGDACSCCDGTGMHDCPDCVMGSNEWIRACTTCGGCGWLACYACDETGSAEIAGDSGTCENGECR